MDTRYPPYPAYKPSGVEWLGEIPSHWDVRRLKFVAGINPDTLPETTPKDYTFAYVDIGNVSSDGRVSDAQEYTFEAAPTRARRKVNTGDTIISTVRTYLQAIAYIEDDLSHCIVSTGFAVLRPRENVHPRFLYYLVRSQGFVDAVMAHSNGVSYPAINPTTLAGLWGLLPPLPEQRAIAAYLDRETAHIDALIAKKRELIDLLERQRTALISHAVTKGLNPAAPLKPSGIPWLGKIPSHWDVLPVWILFSLGRGRVISQEEILNNPGPYPVYSSQTHDSGVMGKINTYDFEGEYLTWTTDGANAGTVFYRNGRFNCTNVCGTLRAKKNIEIKFFAYALGVVTTWFVRQDINPKLMNNVMAKIRIQCPPLPEQHAIAAYLDRETARIDRLKGEIEASIDLLQRYRTALISAAVTGKMDVRAEHAPGAAAILF